MKEVVKYFVNLLDMERIIPILFFYPHGRSFPMILLNDEVRYIFLFIYVIADEIGHEQLVLGR